MPKISELEDRSSTISADVQFPARQPSGSGTFRFDLVSIARFVLPPGSLIPFASGGSVPEGFLACDGSAVSRSTYADLFLAIGTAWGAGNGTTTFNVPNLTGRFVVGVGGTDGAGNPVSSVGQTGGSESVTLTTAQIPAHTHGFSTAGASFMGVNGAGAFGYGAGANGAVASTATGSAGSGNSHTNMPPFASVQWIIKA